MKMYSVTEVLSPYFNASKIAPDVLARACMRGGEVHCISAAIAQGLFAGAYDSDYAGYIQSFKQWFAINVAEVLLIETRITDLTLRFHGQPDFVFKLNFGGTVLVDIKTPLADQKSWALQTAAYRHLVANHKKIKIDDTMSLRLRSDGGPALGKRYGENWLRDFAVFMQALNVYKYLND